MRTQDVPSRHGDIMSPAVHTRIFSGMAEENNGSDRL